MGNVIVSNITRTPVENGSNWGSVSAPSSPGLTGTFTEGNTITLAGSGYGTLGVTTKYDDFEDGTNGQLISARPDWSTAKGNGGDDPIVVSETSYAGSLCGKSPIALAGDSATYLVGDFREVYAAFAYKGRINSGEPSADTVKGFRVNQNAAGNPYSGSPGIYEQEIIDEFSEKNRRRVSTRPEFETTGSAKSYYPSGKPSNDTWTYLEYYWKQGDAGSANGIIKQWKDLSVSLNLSDVITNNAGVTQSWKAALLPFYWGNGSGGDHFYDLVHISFDQGQAKVMATDNAVYASSTKREAMNTLTRVDGEIAFKVPANTFTPASTVYIHVIDVSGASIANYSTEVA